VIEGIKLVISIASNGLNRARLKGVETFFDFFVCFGLKVNKGTAFRIVNHKKFRGLYDTSIACYALIIHVELALHIFRPFRLLIGHNLPEYYS
jgi:hypothetical protein